MTVSAQSDSGNIRSRALFARPSEPRSQEILERRKGWKVILVDV
jgi:hypothetical protein